MTEQLPAWALRQAHDLLGYTCWEAFIAEPERFEDAYAVAIALAAERQKARAEAIGALTNPTEEILVAACLGEYTERDARLALSEVAKVLSAAPGAADEMQPVTDEALKAERAKVDAMMDDVFGPLAPGAAEPLPQVLQPHSDTVWRHKKRGTLYTFVGIADVQATNFIIEGHRVVVYRDNRDGKLWVRPTDEFYDGRFEQLAPGAPEPKE